MVQTLWVKANTRFPSGSLQVWCMLGGGSLHDWPPAETRGAKSLLGLPVDSTPCAFAHFATEGFSVSHVTPLGEVSWTLMPGFLQTSSQALSLGLLVTLLLL